MPGLFEIGKKVGQLNENLLANFIIDVIEDEDISILQDRLEQGLDVEGNPFPPLSETTIGIKRSTGGFISSSGNIAWKDEGNFYDSQKLLKKGDYAEITSDDENAGKIFQRAPTVLDVSQEEANEMFESKRQQYIDKVKNYLFE